MRAFLSSVKKGSRRAYAERRILTNRPNEMMRASDEALVRIARLALLW